MAGSLKTYLVAAMRFEQSMLTYSNTTDPEPAHTGTGTFGLNAIVTKDATPTSGWMSGIPMKRRYQSTVASNTSIPGVSSTWQDIGPANSVAMFTSKISEYTSNYLGISANIRVTKFASCVALFGLAGESVRVRILASNGSVRSDNFKSLVSRPAAIDWLSFFTAGFEQVTQVVFLPLIILPLDTVEITILGNAQCARVVIGDLSVIGMSPQYGASWSMDNYTSADPDEFGYVDPEQKDYAPRNQVSVFVLPERSNAVIATIIALRGVPTLFIGSDDPTFANALINYGLVRDPNHVLTSYGHHLLDFEFKGFV